MIHRTPEAIAMGASAGALDALSTILPLLPSDYPLPILAVVHLPADKTSMLAELLNRKCNLTVKEAEDKEPLSAGVVYLAPPDYHLMVEQDRRLSLSSEEPVLYSRPAIDILFESAADAFGEGLIGVILTGANEDGARGLAAVCHAGGVGLVQSPQSAHSSAMPSAALNACAGALSLSLGEIAQYLKEAVVLP